MATNEPLSIDAGATYVVEFELETAAGAPIDISDFTAELQIRKSPLSPVAVITNTPTITTNKVAVELSATQTSALTDSPYVYAIELYKNTEVARFVDGIVTVSPEVVR